METEMVSLTAYSDQHRLDLEALVRNATWKDVLYELRDSGQLDPWNVDLSTVVDAYLDMYRKMASLDLKIPGSIIQAAAVLLRMKSDSLTIFEIEEIDQTPPDEILKAARQIPEVPTLTPKLRMHPGKRITLMELMQALDSAIKAKEHREAILVSSVPQVLTLPAEDINDKIEAVERLIRANLDKTGLAVFSHIARDAQDGAAVVSEIFIPLLFSAHKGRLTLMQERFFGEILIRLTDVGGNSNGESAE